MNLLFAIIFALTLFVLPSFSQEDNSWMLWENGVGKRWLVYHLEKEDALKMKGKWEEIEDSSEKSSREYAGTYYKHGYMSGYFLRWSPDKGYIYIKYFDVEHPCYFSYGDVFLNGIEINFNPVYETKESICPGKPETPTTWIPANGGEYLIPKTEVRDFADFYGGFGEYNGFLRKVDGDYIFAAKWVKDFKPKQNFVLPKGFEKFVKAPINGEIISIGKSRKAKLENFFLFENYVTITPVQINAGKKHGVKKGFEFVLLNSDDDKYQTLIITNVSNIKSKGNVIRYIDKDGKEGFSDYDHNKNEFVLKPFTPLRIGLKVTTSPISKL